MNRFILVAVLIHVSSIVAFSNELYDNEFLSYLEPTNSKYESAKPLQQLRILDNNFLRHGRNQNENYLSFMNELDSEDEDEDENYEFARPTRSQDKNDNFVRFGRGNSDFIRFGRDPYKYDREIRTGNQNFLRFGRSVSELDAHKIRNKREITDNFSAANKRKGDGDNFLRFGKSGDDSFIRYGRNPNTNNDSEELSPKPTTSHSAFLSNLFHKHSAYPFKSNGKLSHSFPLLNILRNIENNLREK